MVAKKPYLIITLRLKYFIYVLTWKQMNDDSYHMPIWIDISIFENFSSALGINYRKKWYQFAYSILQ